MRVNKRSYRKNMKKRRENKKTTSDRTWYKHEKHTRIEYQQLICCVSLAVQSLQYCTIERFVKFNTNGFVFLRSTRYSLQTAHTCVSQRARATFPLRTLLFIFVPRSIQLYHIRAFFVSIRIIHVLVACDLLLVWPLPLLLFETERSLWAVQTEEEQESTPADTITKHNSVVQCSQSVSLRTLRLNDVLFQQQARVLFASTFTDKFQR